MLPAQRDAAILDRLYRCGVVTVDEIASLCNCSLMSVRRDLRRLEERGVVKRTHGGAVLVAAPAERIRHSGDSLLQIRNNLIDRSEVLMITPWMTPWMGVLIERARRSGLPIIAESINYQGAATCVTIDDYGAGVELGRWVGANVREHIEGQVRVLLVGSVLPNCAARARGFVDGARSLLRERLSLVRVEGKDVRRLAREVVASALTVHGAFDVVFGINDDVALGALDAWQEAGLDTSDLMVAFFGLEGAATRDLLDRGSPRAVALAMFPELVGRACVDAAVCAYHGCALPERVVMPHAILTHENLPEFYERAPLTGAWVMRAGAAERLTTLSPTLATLTPCNGRPRPGRIGFVEVFSSHEWYQNVERAMSERARTLGIRLEVIDASQDLEQEIEHLAQAIGRAAAELVIEGDTIILDSGPATAHLADALRGRRDITIISNSLDVLGCLAQEPGIRLMATGGMVRGADRALVGRAAEESFGDLRASKVFLTCSGLSTGFGISSLSTSELGVKQAMLRAAREVVVLSDHTRIGIDSLVKVAPIEAIHRVVTDAGISEFDRLALAQRGIEVTIADA